MNGQSRIYRVVAERILQVSPGPVPSALLDAVGTRRRLQALVADGWSVSDLARRLTSSESDLCQVINGRRLRIRPARAAAVRALFVELVEESSPPQGRAAERARRRAARAGWAVPDAWDWDELDDPAAKPRRRGGFDESRERLEDLAWLSRSTSIDDAAARVGFTVKQAKAKLRDAGRLDLLARFNGRPVFT